MINSGSETIFWRDETQTIALPVNDVGCTTGYRGNFQFTWPKELFLWYASAG
jgi:hypothetical protein